MESKSLQEFVKRIFSDEKAREQFMADPDSVASQLKLTEQEKKAALKTFAGIGLVASSSPQMAAALNNGDPWVAS